MLKSFSEHLFETLEKHGVEYIFGIPGVHTAEIYRALAGTSIRHITPRHEQGAGFMADGYARVTGRPGVCLVITGPGLANISTAMLQAQADSIPMLVFATCNNPSNIPLGRLHEMRDQSAFGEQIASISRRIDHPEHISSAIDDAFALFEHGRPGPVLLQIPLDVIHSKDIPHQLPQASDRGDSASGTAPDLREVAKALNQTQSPVIVIGGGAKHAASEILDLAERLDAPIVTTINACSCLPSNHPLVVRASPSLSPIRSLIDDADFVLAVGTEIGPTDFNVNSEGRTISPKRLARIDIDPEILKRSIRADHEIICDSKVAIAGLLQSIPEGRTSRGGHEKVVTANKAAYDGLSPAYKQYVQTLKLIGDALPGVIIVGDSTQLIYAGNLFYPSGKPNGWFNSAVGFGTLGYALPAAIGARLADLARPVIALIGDGGMQFTLPELGTLRDLGMPLTILIWNNDGYGEIRTFMEDRSIEPEGVNISPPKYDLIAKAYDIDYIELEVAMLETELAGALQAASKKAGATIIEIIDQ